LHSNELSGVVATNKHCGDKLTTLGLHRMSPMHDIPKLNESV